jgi:hypothetical protein
LEIRVTNVGDLPERGQAFKHIDAYEETKGWRDQSFAWIIPTAGNFVHWDVVDSWDNVDMPMNQTRTGRLRSKNMEVGEAYNYLFKLTMEEDVAASKYHPEYAALVASTRFVFTTEHDNILPTNAITGLMGAIYTCPDCGGEITDTDEWLCDEGHKGYDAVSGLYFTKGIPPRPMAYGNPKNGPDDFTPQSVKEAVEKKQTIEVNGIGMGCAVWRKDLFKKVSEPWFQTIDKDNMQGIGGATQDLHFCKKAKAEADARFGVNCGVKVGHVNLKTGTQHNLFYYLHKKLNKINGQIRNLKSKTTLSTERRK